MYSTVSKFLLLILCCLWLPVQAGEATDTTAVTSPITDTDTKPLVVLKTNLGDITLQLDAANAPISVANFLAYVDSGFYSNTLFHRVIPGFMIQGGGYGLKLEDKKTDDPIKNEAANGLINNRGTIALARTSDIDSATSQFFINTVDNASLNHSESSYGYAVFGKVIEGMEVVDKIEMTPTKRSGSFANLPVEAVTLLSVSQKSKH